MALSVSLYITRSSLDKSKSHGKYERKRQRERERDRDRETERETRLYPRDSLAILRENQNVFIQKISATPPSNIWTKEIKKRKREKGRQKKRLASTKHTFVFCSLKLWVS